MIIQQRGVALLTILLLVVSITIVAGSMLASQKIMVRQYELMQNQGQFYQYALAGEAFAKQLLVEDSQNNSTDSLQDVWAKPIPDYLIAGGQVKIQLHDESSLFNINNLYHHGKVDHVAVNYLKAIFVSAGLEPEIVMAIVDWQDPDSEPSGNGGAEFDYYQSLGKKNVMSIANQPFVSVDELLFVRGMNKQKLAKIKPFLTVVPSYLPMNVNTVKPELLVVLPLVENVETNSQQTASTPASTSTPTSQSSLNMLDLTAVSQWASQRGQNLPLNQVAELWQIPIFATVNSQQQQTLTPLFAVESQAFRFVGTVTVGEKQRFFTSQLLKNGQSQQVNDNLLQNSLSNQKQIIAFNQQLLPIAPKF